MGKSRLKLLGVVLVTCMTPAWTSLAEPTLEELANARADFRQALALQTAGDWGGALSLLQHVAAVATTPQVRFNIALCEEHLGRLSAALGDYQIAGTLADAAHLADVVKEATSRVAKLRERQPHVAIKRGRGAEVARLSLDGNELGESALAGDIPVDPGPHQIDARAPSGPLPPVSFQIGEGERQVVEVTGPEPVPAPRLKVVVDEHPPESAPRRSLLLPFVLGGVGVAGLATAGVFALLEQSAISDLDRACGPNRNACPPFSKGTYDAAKTDMTVARVALVVGAVGIGAATVLLLTGKHSQAQAARVPFDVMLGAPGAVRGASLKGWF